MSTRDIVFLSNTNMWAQRAPFVCYSGAHCERAQNSGQPPEQERRLKKSSVCLSSGEKSHTKSISGKPLSCSPFCRRYGPSQRLCWKSLSNTQGACAMEWHDIMMWPHQQDDFEFPRVPGVELANQHITDSGNPSFDHKIFFFRFTGAAGRVRVVSAFKCWSVKEGTRETVGRTERRQSGTQGVEV